MGMVGISWLISSTILVALVLADAPVVAADANEGAGRLVIVTHMTPEVASGYGRHTRKINEHYAAKHGYRFVVDTEDYVQGERDPRWNKVAAMRTALAGARPEEEAIMWIDADAALTNFDFAAHTLLSQATTPGTDLLICRDLSVPKSSNTCGATCLNTGVLLLRATAWSAELVSHWWSMPNSSPSLAFGADHEESALAALYADGWGGLRDKAQVFKATAFNSIPPFHMDHDASQPVMHASGEPSAVREAVFAWLAAAITPPSSTHPAALDLASVLPSLPALVSSAYEAAHVTDPQDAHVASVLASIVRGNGGEGSAERARTLLRQAMELSPGDPDRAVSYGSLAAQIHEDWCDAASAFLAAARLEPASETTAQLLRNANYHCAQQKKAQKRGGGSGGYLIAASAGAAVLTVVYLVVTKGDAGRKTQESRGATKGRKRH